jgi:hypothetical protein
MPSNPPIDVPIHDTVWAPERATSAVNVDKYTGKT